MNGEQKHKLAFSKTLTLLPVIILRNQLVLHKRDRQTTSNVFRNQQSDGLASGDHLPSFEPNVLVHHAA